MSDDSYTPSTLERPSYSRLSTFSECERKYWFRYVWRREDEAPPTAPMYFGTVGHAALASYYRTFALEAALDTIADKWEDGAALVTKRFEHLTRPFLEIVIRSYVEYWEPRDEIDEVVATELALLDGEALPQTGAADLITREAGELVVTDFKLTSAYLGKDYYQYEPQLRLYGLGVQEKLGELPGLLRVRALHTGSAAYLNESSKAQRFAEYAQVPGPVEYRDASEWFFEARGRALRLDGSPERSYHKDPGRKCSWCEYASECHFVSPDMREGR